ncbi:MAG TPA: DUF2723 domain-containing protein [Mucilaginibacter sp.]|nr:DUF2723 domain-containing protein [Mucilaginibacter sp.]
MHYKKINNLLGWLCFVIASVTYILTLEPSVSFWDCGEFISCAYRLQVSHQPGYPLFAMLGKAFSLLSLGNTAKVPYFTNLMSALASGATIMFLFWTITALAKKLLAGRKDINQQQQLYLIMGAGLIGALAFTFTDTFWFSAVETIVFALSSLCTAIVFWAILKWEAVADEAGADKWIILIAYMVGLSIGIHLLNLLTIPAIVMVYYFRRNNKVTAWRSVAAFFISIVILALVQFGIRGYTIQFAAFFDLFFVNSLGFGFGSGAAVFFLLLVVAIAGGIWYSIRKRKPMLNLALLCIAFIYFGYSSFVYIPIRASANTDLNNSHPDNAFTLYGYLNRIQYGETPLLSGPYFDAKITDQKEGNTIYRKGKTKYESAGKRMDYVYDHTTLLPRMWSTETDQYYEQNARFYKQWLQLADGQSPTFADNLKWMFSWQMYQMYARYFLWNFVGRYNQLDGQQSTVGLDGNWTSGIFNGGKHLPKSVTGGITYTPLYALPFILGLIGMLYHFKRNKRDALIIALLFFFTGIAIVLYVNQNSLQPRERDYSYVGSFYAFAIWMGFGVIGIAEIVRRRFNARVAAMGSFAICMVVPLLLAVKEWRGHDRSTKMIPHDMAYNYLISCPKNAILFTNGDNDTYSLWYDQEVEGIRPDVRIVCMSLFSGDWYIHQMQKKMNQSAPLPVTMPFDKYKAGVRDVIYFNDAKIAGAVELKDVFDFITSDDERAKVTYQDGETLNYLPTKHFKITVNADDLVKKGVITPQQKNKVADAMEWKIPSNYLTKDNLAMIDILAHNDWKRPICFTTTMAPDAMFGLQSYLYKEGFVYHLIPFKTDNTDAANDGSKTNSLVMYDNVVNKFKFGNFKKTKYLDDVSLTQFYLTIERTFNDLANGLIKDGRNDLALKAIRKFNEKMPDINPDIDTAVHKYFLAETAYNLGDKTIGSNYVKGVQNFVTDQLDYNYYLLQNNKPGIDQRTVQLGMQLLDSMADTTKNNEEADLSKKLKAQLADYSNKFAVLMR